MHPKDLSITEFNYSLPPERIASYPLAERDASKLLVYRNGDITQDIYRNISDHIPENSLLLFNDTKVIEARLLFRKPSGGTIEIFCLEPPEQYPDISTAMLQQGSVLWKCLVGGASKWKPGQVLEKKFLSNNTEIKLTAAYKEKRTGYFLIELSWSSAELSFAEILHHTGSIPLPPYIKRKVEDADAERYQTIYAQYDGSVAAPTAGLHFTDAIFQYLKEKNITQQYVTLHVGTGTFQPVKAATMEHHDMHGEFIDVSKETIEHLLKGLSNPIIPVGTTSLRTLESLYWLGVKLSQEVRHEIRELGQWEAYDDPRQDMPAEEALGHLIRWMEETATGRILAKTRIIIAPGYRPRLANALITNFHQPQSTLLLLLAALVGDDWKRIYTYAMENDFRFLSYGDGSLIWCR